MERELIDTERAYITSMKLVHSHFLHPVRENMEEWELTEQDVSEIFGNIETLLQCHENFLAILLSQKKPNSYPPASYLSHALIEFGSNVRLPIPAMPARTMRTNKECVATG